MLKIKKLEIEGFRSFKTRTVLEFPDAGTVLISGKYTGSDISSGSGKSSILMAIGFALDICDLPATELKNWESSKMHVSVTINDDNGNEYNIIRNPKLNIVINGTPYESMVTGAKEKLQSILQTSPSLLQALTYRPQRSTGKFINMTDSEMKDFLSNVLGLDSLEIAAETVASDLSAAIAGIDRTKATVAGMKQVLESSVLKPEDLDKAKKDYETADLRVKALESDNSSIEMEGVIKTIQNKLYEANTIIQQSQQAQYQNQSIKTQVISLNDEIEKLKNETCYTCNREWHNGTGLLDSKKVKIKDLLEKMEVNVSIIKNSEPIINNVQFLQGKLSEAQVRLGQMKAPLSDAYASKAAAGSVLRNLTGMFETRKNNAESVVLLEEKLKQQESGLSLLKIQEEILGRNGFLGTIFDEVLREIEMRTNDMLKFIPNVSEFTLTISSVTVTKSNGNAKRCISKKLYKNGKEIAVKSLSGGQQASLELCADLAVAETIKARHGSQLGWIALDEAMDGLGVVEKQAALEMIRSKVNGLVLIIDHATEIKEGFEKVIEIEFDGKESHVI